MRRWQAEDVLLYAGTAAEQKALESLCQEWGAHEFWPFKEFLISLQIPGTFLLYALLEETWGGFALGRAQGDAAELFFIFVQAGARGSGLGQTLLGAFAAHAGQIEGVQRIFLEVRVSNRQAISLYERENFQVSGRRKRYYSDGEDALIFEKRLALLG